jgi:hypothetical protein
MGFYDTYMLLHMPSRSRVYLNYGMYGSVLQSVLDARAWSLSDIVVVEDRHDDLQDTLSDFGIGPSQADLEEHESMFSEWFHYAFTTIDLKDILPNASSGRCHCHLERETPRKRRAA